jgi:hypothetical protein
VGDPRLKENYFKINPGERKCEDVDCIQLPQERAHWRALVEHGNEAWDSMQVAFDQLNKYRLFKEDSVLSTLDFGYIVVNETVWASEMNKLNIRYVAEHPLK